MLTGILQPRLEDVEEFLKKSATANTSIHPGVGDGNNLRLQSEEVIDGALSLDYQLGITTHKNGSEGKWRL